MCSNTMNDIEYVPTSPPSSGAKLVISPVSVCDDILGKSMSSLQPRSQPPRIVFSRNQSSSALLQSPVRNHANKFSINSGALLGDGFSFQKSMSMRNLEQRSPPLSVDTKDNIKLRYGTVAKLVDNRFNDTAEKTRNIELSNSRHSRDKNSLDIDLKVDNDRIQADNEMTAASERNFSRRSLHCTSSGVVMLNEAKKNKIDSNKLMKATSERAFSKRSLYNKQNSRGKVDSENNTTNPLLTIDEYIEKSRSKSDTWRKSPPKQLMKAASERGIPKRMLVRSSKEKSVRNLQEINVGSDLNKVPSKDILLTALNEDVLGQRSTTLKEDVLGQRSTPIKKDADELNTVSPVKMSKNGQSRSSRNLNSNSKSPSKRMLVSKSPSKKSTTEVNPMQQYSRSNSKDSIDYVMNQNQHGANKGKTLLSGSSTRTLNAKSPSRRVLAEATTDKLEKADEENKRRRSERMSDPITIAGTISKSDESNLCSQTQRKRNISMRNLNTKSMSRKSLYTRSGSNKNVTGFDDEELDPVLSPEESIQKNPIPVDINLSKVDDEGWPNKLMVTLKKSVSPKDYLIRLLKLMGKSFCTYEARKSAYFSEPTQLQINSCGSYLNDIVCKSRDPVDLEEYLSCGVSLNPTTEYGDSLIHQLCRRGDEVLVNAVLKCYNKAMKTDDTRKNIVNPFQISNAMGRTPLHETCCSPKTRFRIVDIILRCDPYLLLVTDQHGCIPLEYISMDQWPKWIVYLNAKFHEYFNEKTSMEPPLSRHETNSWSIPVSKASLSPEMATFVASGELTSKDAKKFTQNIYTQWYSTQTSDEMHYFDHTAVPSIKDSRSGDEGSDNKDAQAKNKLTQSFRSSTGLLDDDYDDYAYYIRSHPKIQSLSQEEN